MRMRRETITGLATYVWLPEHKTRAVLVMRTPYGAREYAAEAAGWTAHDIALVVQDVRGRHESPGEFRPYREHECLDGPDLITWVRTWADAPVVAYGVSYGAHAALAAMSHVDVDAVMLAVPALGLGETARTRGGVLQLGSRLGWWLAHDVRRPWGEVESARRRDRDRADEVARAECPLLVIGGTDDYFAHDTVDLWEAWGAAAQLVLGPWDHSLVGSQRARRSLRWLEQLLSGETTRGVETIDRAGVSGHVRPMCAVVTVPSQAPPDAPELWCASLTVPTPQGDRREVARGASLVSAQRPQIELGPVVLSASESEGPELILRGEDFPRYARRHGDPRRLTTRSLHAWELTA